MTQTLGDLEAAYRVRLRNRGIPFHMQDAIIRYLVHGIPPGHFLEAVLSNNLYEAVGRCDAANEPFLADYVRFFHQYAPMAAWGAPEKVWTWIEQHAQMRVQDR